MKRCEKARKKELDEYVKRYPDRAQTLLYWAERLPGSAEDFVDLIGEGELVLAEESYRDMAFCLWRCRLEAALSGDVWPTQKV